MVFAFTNVILESGIGRQKSSESYSVRKTHSTIAGIAGGREPRDTGSL